MQTRHRQDLNRARFPDTHEKFAGVTGATGATASLDRAASIHGPISPLDSIPDKQFELLMGYSNPASPSGPRSHTRTRTYTRGSLVISTWILATLCHNPAYLFFPSSRVPTSKSIPAMLARLEHLVQQRSDASAPWRLAAFLRKTCSQTQSTPTC